MSRREQLLLVLLGVAVVVVAAWFVFTPQVIPMYCPANPDYCPPSMTP